MLFTRFSRRGRHIRLWVNASLAAIRAKLWKLNLGAAGGNFQMGFPYGDTIAIFKLAK
jgi:hypothetical protein